MILLKVLNRFAKKFQGIIYFATDLFTYSKLNKTKRFKISAINFYPCLSDRTSTTDFDRHYVYHTAWAIRKVTEMNPVKHIDISSSLFFCSALSATITTEFYDYRPAPLKLSNLKTNFSDLSNLPFTDNSIESLSCMHVVEHVGLGRYGDKMNPEGDLKAISELKRVVKQGGTLLFVVPVGKERVQFNAHRIYSLKQIVDLFKDWTLEELYLIPDKNYSEEPILNPTIETVENQNYGCGCFLFRKVDPT